MGFMRFWLSIASGDIKSSCIMYHLFMYYNYCVRVYFDVYVHGDVVIYAILCIHLNIFMYAFTQLYFYWLLVCWLCPALCIVSCEFALQILE